MFFKICVLKKFATLTGKHLCWPFQAFFYKTSRVAASGVLLQQISFSAKRGMYWRQSHRFLSRTLLKTRVKPQKQPLQLFYKKTCSQKFYKFHRKTSVFKFLFNRVAGQETQTQMISCGIYEGFRGWCLRMTASETCWSVLKLAQIVHNFHCAKSVQVWSVFLSLFSRNWTEYREIRSIQSKCGKMQTRKNSVFRHFSRSVLY